MGYPHNIVEKTFIDIPLKVEGYTYERRSYILTSLDSSEVVRDKKT